LRPHTNAITQLPIDELRGGSVKARRPRARAVEAKRRALHAAEHSANIERVMADVHVRVTLAITRRDFRWSRNMFSDWAKFFRKTTVSDAVKDTRTS
jgi:hypothetical protein